MNVYLFLIQLYRAAVTCCDVKIHFRDDKDDFYFNLLIEETIYSEWNQKIASYLWSYYIYLDNLDKVVL